MATITVDGVEVVISGGKAKLSARSWQAANSSMWRPGSAQANYASSYSAKANRVIQSLNSTGSYVNSKGMRTYINRGNDILKYGSVIRQQADRGTEAWAVQQRIASMGGLEPQPTGASMENVVGEMIDEIMTDIENIGEDIAQKAQAYFDRVSDITSNIGQSIVDIFTD